MITGTDLFIGMFDNLAVFIVLIAVYGLLISAFKNTASVPYQIAVGVCFGLCAMACMHVKIPVADGVIVDQRNAVVALCGAFGSPLSALICAAAAALYRVELGGAGVTGGVTGIFLSAIAGLGLRALRRTSKSPLRWALGSAAAAVFILPGFAIIGDIKKGLALMASMALPYGGALFLGIFLVGLLLTHEETRQAAHVAIERSERQFRDMFERLVDVSYRTDAQGRILYLSPSATKLFGYEIEKLIGKPVGDFYRFPELRETFVTALSRDGRVENFEAELRNKDGTFTWVSTNAIIVQNADGKFIGVEGVTRDISRLKKAEAEKTALEDSLRQRQKMEALGTLAGGIAHDFNNILGAVIGYTELSIEGIPKESRQHGYMTSVLSAAERAAQLTRQILMFSRKQKSVKSRLRLGPVVEEAAGLLRNTLPSDVRLHLDLPGDSPLVLADATQIHQIILNLCTNAYHALPYGTGEISVSLSELTSNNGTEKRPSDLKPGRYAVLSVSDNGTGMTSEVLPRIFEPFFTTKKRGQGTGLGLSVVHGIITDHDGTVDVESAPSKGTTIRIFLPVVEEERSLEETTDDAVMQGSESILFVDDEPALAEVGRLTLSALGYTVRATVSAMEALDWFKNAPDSFDLIITDQTMPRLSGDALARAAAEIRPNIPVIICTGHSAQMDESKAAAMGIAAFLMKPLSRSEIAKTVRNVLDASRREAQAQSYTPEAASSGVKGSPR